MKNPVLPRIIADHLGSIRVTLDQNGNIDSWTDYYPFGKEARGSSTSNRPKEQFTGKERDTEIGLDYFGARYYNPDIVRWTSVDPLWEKHPDWTPYNYVLGNPLLLVDPDGKQVDFNKAFQAYNVIKENFQVTLGTGAGVGAGLKIPVVGSVDVGLDIVSASLSAKGNDEWNFNANGPSISGSLNVGGANIAGGEATFLYVSVSSTEDPKYGLGKLEGLNPSVGTDNKTKETKSKVSMSNPRPDNRYKKNGNLGASIKAGVINVGVEFDVLGAIDGLIGIFGEDNANTEKKDQETNDTELDEE